MAIFQNKVCLTTDFLDHSPTATWRFSAEH